MQNYFAIETEAAHRRRERERRAAHEQQALASMAPEQRLRIRCRHTLAVLYSRMDSRRRWPSWPAAEREPHLPVRICTTEPS